MAFGRPLFVYKQNNLQLSNNQIIAIQQTKLKFIKKKNKNREQAAHRKTNVPSIRNRSITNHLILDKP